MKKMNFYKVTVKVKEQFDSRFDEIKTLVLQAKSEQEAVEKTKRVAMQLTTLAFPSHAVLVSVE